MKVERHHTAGHPAGPSPDLSVVRDLLLLRRQAPILGPARAAEITRTLVPDRHVLHARIGLMLLAEPGPALVQACGDRAIAATLAEAAGGVEQAARYLVALSETLSLSAERIIVALTARPDALQVAQQVRALREEVRNG